MRYFSIILHHYRAAVAGMLFLYCPSLPSLESSILTELIASLLALPPPTTSQENRTRIHVMQRNLSMTSRRGCCALHRGILRIPGSADANSPTLHFDFRTEKSSNLKKKELKWGYRLGSSAYNIGLQAFRRFADSPYALQVEQNLNGIFRAT